MLDDTLTQQTTLLRCTKRFEQAEQYQLWGVPRITRELRSLSSCLTSLRRRRSDSGAGNVGSWQAFRRATEPTESRGLTRPLRLGHRNVHLYSTFREDSYA